MEFLKAHTFTVVNVLSTLTVLGQAIALTLLIVLIKEKISGTRGGIARYLEKHALSLMLIVALTATLGSLFFSDIAGWTPCKDCWFQRIFLYPQAVLLAIAVWKRDANIAIYILILSLIGMGISIDHYADQVEAALHPVDPVTLKPCDETGVSCAATQIKFTYGFVTIPMMALTASLLNAIGSTFLLRKKA